MKALIIGAAGFVGGYLSEHLLKCGYDVCATKLEQEKVSFDKKVSVYDLDILDEKSVFKLLETLKPDMIFHLAAQSSVKVSWERPGLTADINVRGTINVLEAAHRASHEVRILLVGSGEEYGYLKPEDIPVKEDTLLRAGNIYAVTKACQGMLGEVYSRAYGMDIIMVRAFNHIGPKQAPQFVISDFCRQVARIEKGLNEPVIYVGNLSARRDFTDVRDIVRAYELLMRKGKRGETYNVGSGTAVSIESMLKKILSLSDAEIDVRTDPSKLRPSDVPVIAADISKITADTGWKPEISVDETIKNILDHWREAEKL